MSEKQNEFVWDSHLKRSYFDPRGLGAMGIMVFTPLINFLFSASLMLDRGNVFHTFQRVIKTGILSEEIISLYDISVDNYFPLKSYFFWIFFCFLLAKFLPGKIYKGGMTPGGNCLDYNCNGFQAFVISCFLYVSGSVFGLFDGSVVARYFSQYLIISHSFGMFMTVFSYLKGRIIPTHPNDVRVSGNFFLDLFAGIELNPRIFGVDFKLFFNARPGITMWPLINFSFMVYQYQTTGQVSYGMAVLNFLQFLYCADYFWNENWYLKTIDIQTDAFGFYLAWGDLAWLPFMYTLQSQFIRSSS